MAVLMAVLVTIHVLFIPVTYVTLKLWAKRAIKNVSVCLMIRRCIEEEKNVNSDKKDR